MILEIAMWWTIFWNDTQTVLQYPTKLECIEAIEAGLPYIGVPPNSELRCELAPRKVWK